MSNFKVYTTFNKSLGQTASSAWKCLKTQFWGPLTENLNPLQRPTHTLTLSINTEQVKKLRMDLSWHTLNSMLQAKTHTEKQGFGYPWLSKKKKFQTRPPNPLKQSPVSESQLTPPLTSGLEFWPQIYSLWQALDCRKGLECRKVNFLEYLARELLDVIHFSACMYNLLTLTILTVHTIVWIYL